MADNKNCCDPIILPACTPKCAQLVDACCVVHEAVDKQSVLNCLFPNDSVPTTYRQCDINKAINDLLCSATCSTYTIIPYHVAIEKEIQWEIPSEPGISFIPPQATLKSCEVRLRGHLTGLAQGSDVTTDGFIVSIIGVTPFPPANYTALSVNVDASNHQAALSNPDLRRAPSAISKIYPGLLIIDLSGIMTLRITPDVTTQNYPARLFFALDGLTYTTTP